MTEPTPTHTLGDVVLLVDAANVIGSRPDGWWRDRVAATRTLVADLRDSISAGRLDPPVVVVIEGAARAGPPEGHSGGVEVVHATGSGDDTLVEMARTVLRGSGTSLLPAGDAGDTGDTGRGRTSAPGPAPGVAGVVAVTADRELRGRLQGVGARAVGPSWLRDRLQQGPAAGRKR